MSPLCARLPEVLWAIDLPPPELETPVAHSLPGSQGLSHQLTPGSLNLTKRRITCGAGDAQQNAWTKDLGVLKEPPSHMLCTNCVRQNHM